MKLGLPILITGVLILLCFLIPFVGIPLLIIWALGSLVALILKKNKNHLRD
jgi:hypothetical protein